MLAAASDLPPDELPPDWADRMASTSWAFFIVLAPLIPRPPAICLSSGSSLLLNPPDERPDDAEVVPGVVSVVSDT